MNDIVIIGAGGFGREVAWLIEEINKVEFKWNIKGFVDENINLRRKAVNGYKILGDLEWLKHQNCYAVCAIGDTDIRKNIIQRLTGSKIKYPVLIHPSVIKSNTVNIGEGSIICAGSILTVNIEIGKHVIINLDCTVGHDVWINDYSTILPSVNISGRVKLEECVNVGTNCSIIQGIKIDKNTIIGAGSVVVKDLPSNCTAVGVPAKLIKFKGSEIE